MNIDSHGTTDWSRELYRHAEKILWEKNKTLVTPLRGHRAEVIICDDPLKEKDSLVATRKNHMVKNPYARPGFYYVDAYMDLISEIEEVTSKSRNMAANKELAPLEKRQYFHYYQRLHSYGGFEWDTNNFGINPNQ